MYTIEEYDKEKSKVLKYVLYKKKTKKEIKNKFSSSIESEMLNDIIDELEEIGYINDNEYIKRSINDFIKLNNMSLKEVRYKLMAKGISNDLIDDYMQENEEMLEDYEIESAKKIIIKKQNQMEEDELIKYLLKKGYQTSNIRQAIEKMDE